MVMAMLDGGKMAKDMETQSVS